MKPSLVEDEIVFWKDETIFGADEIIRRRGRKALKVKVKFFAK